MVLELGDLDRWGTTLARCGPLQTGGPNISPPDRAYRFAEAGMTGDGTPTRRCSRCRESRPLAAFRLDSRGYLRSHCNPCALAVTREWRARHHAELLDRRRAQRPAPVGYHLGPRPRLETAPSLFEPPDGGNR